MPNQLRTFRFSGWGNALATQLLSDEGFIFEPLPFYAGAGRLIHGPKPLGSSLAAYFGHIYIQDASSMLPALSLMRVARHSAAQRNPAPDTVPDKICVLDMCASPGGKSSLLATELKKAFVLANEPAGKRLNALRHNLHSLNMFNCASSAFDATAFPLSMDNFAGWDYILLDPPCSGWGTAEKNPQVLRLWQGDKVKPLINLQKKLFTEAWRLLKPGGTLIYSTCTTNPEENEAQTLYMLERPQGDASLLTLPLFEGFDFDEPALGLRGVLRVAQKSSLGQGFFIAALRKAGVPCTAAPGPVHNLPPGELIHSSGIDTPLLDSALLPPGQILLQNGKLLFYPEAGLELLPASFKYSGFCLNSVNKGASRANQGNNAGSLWAKNTHTGLRGLMPTPQEAQAKNALILNMEELGPIKKLVSGQSLNLDLAKSNPIKEAGLYYKNLPLCRLKIKGNRAFI
jgi:16S rRNA (cytosine1407-C5)-methyltransferase